MEYLVIVSHRNAISHFARILEIKYRKRTKSNYLSENKFIQAMGFILVDKS